MAYLAGLDGESPLRALAIQERLWSRYTEWGGITGMPTMHVGQATVVFLPAPGPAAHPARVGPPWLALRRRQLCGDTGSPGDLVAFRRHRQVVASHDET